MTNAEIFPVIFAIKFDKLFDFNHYIFAPEESVQKWPKVVGQWTWNEVRKSVQKALGFL